MVDADVPQVQALLSAHLSNYKLVVSFSEEDVRHWLLPREGVVDCFVVEDPVTKKITDFTSFYTLPSTVIGHPDYNELKAAYSFYNVSSKTPLVELMGDALIKSRDQDFDVFNCLDLMENESFLDTLKFGKGDGYLQYYLYNWKCKALKANEVGLVLL